MIFVKQYFIKSFWESRDYKVYYDVRMTSSMDDDIDRRAAPTGPWGAGTVPGSKDFPLDLYHP